MSDSLCRKLDDFLADCLPESERSRFVDHLTTCRLCQRERRVREHLDGLLASADSELGTVPAGLALQIQGRLHRAKWRRRWFRGLAAAAIVAMVAATWWATRRNHPPQFRPIPGLGTPEQPAVVQHRDDNVPASDQHTHVRPAVRILFDPTADAIAVPIESRDPSVSIFWLYPTVGGPKPHNVPESTPTQLSPWSET